MRNLLRLTILSLLLISSALAQNTFPSTGNVGIGTNTPNQSLQVFGNISLNNATDNYGLNKSYFLYTDQGSTFSYYSYGWHLGFNNSWRQRFFVPGYADIAFSTNIGNPTHQSDFKENMTIQGPTGNVGIGVTGPAMQLSLGFSITSGYKTYSQVDQGGFQYYFPNISSNHYSRVMDISAIGSNDGLQSGGGEIRLLTNPSTSNTSIERMRIDRDGNVYIGTPVMDNGNYKLFVESGIRTRKIKVDQLAWPDYVFEKNYKLSKLNEIEKYIDKNKHLRDVPSAEEVQKDGLDLGYNQSILLKKIEELTLLLIDQNKGLETLNKQLEKLKSSNIIEAKKIELLQKKLEKLETNKEIVKSR